MMHLVLDALQKRPALREKLRSAIRQIGYDTTDWVRSVMYERSFEFIRALGPERLNVLGYQGEISGLALSISSHISRQTILPSISAPNYAARVRSHYR